MEEIEKRKKDDGDEGVIPVSKKDKAVKKEQFEYIYGNYSKYYGYRTTGILTNEFADQRLYILQKLDFKDKKCLDIGCNIGYITTEIGILLLYF